MLKNPHIQTLHWTFATLLIACAIRGAVVQAIADPLSIEMAPDNKQIVINGERSLIADVDQKQFTDRIAYFNEVLSRFHLSLRVISCRRIIDLPVENAQGNHSFGGICQIQDAGNEIRMLICADEDVGHLALVPPFETDVFASELAIFTAQNCFGG